MFSYLYVLFHIEFVLVVALFAFRYALAPSGRPFFGTKLVVITLLTPAVGLLAGNIYIFYAYLALVIALTSRRRAEMCAVYLMILPMMPELFRQNFVGSINIMPFSAVTSMNVGAGLGLLFTARRRPAVLARLDVGAVAIVALTSFIITRDQSSLNIGRSLLLTTFQYGLPYLVISRSIASRQDLDRVLVALCMGGFLGAMINVYQALRAWVMYQSINEALHLPLALGSITMFVRGGHLRVGGPMLDPAAFGLFLVIVLCVLPAVRGYFRRVPYYAILGTILLALAATQSRGSWIAGVGAYVAASAYRRYYVRSVLILAAAATAQLFLSVILPKSSGLAEMLGLSGQALESGNYRRDLFWTGIDQVRRHPIIGQSGSQLKISLSSLTQGQHIIDFVNTHLYIALSSGLIGFGIWSAIWMTAIVLPWRRGDRSRDAGWRDLAQVPVTIIVTEMIALFFTSLIDRNLLWAMMALGLIGPALAFRRDRGPLPARRMARSGPIDRPVLPSVGGVRPAGVIAS